VLLYVFLCWVGTLLFSNVMYFVVPNAFVVGPLAVFAAGAVANAITLRIWGSGHLSDIGMQWNPGSGRNALIGAGLGIAAALFAVLAPVVLRVSSIGLARAGVQWSSLVFLTVLLLFGAAGEEIMLRGYGFQFLVGRLGPFATILPVAVIFGALHALNPNQTWIGLANTVLWGVVLGYAFLRSGDLWLPIGLHFGWNWVLPLFGTPLSGLDTPDVAGLTTTSTASPWITGGNYGPEGGVFTTVAAIALFWWLGRAPVRRQKSKLARLDPAEWEVPSGD
jgi:membrane protease YdiL (CAAX protease family)